MTVGQYSNKLRIRSCGLLFKKDKLLLVELNSPITNEWIWMPPGGGVEFGESLEETLIREFKEETGLMISVKERMHINEVIELPIHAIEFYFKVERTGGRLGLGEDPESDQDSQLLRDIGFFSKEQIKAMNIKPDFLNEQVWDILGK